MLGLFKVKVELSQFIGSCAQDASCDGGLVGYGSIDGPYIFGKKFDKTVGLNAKPLFKIRTCVSIVLQNSSQLAEVRVAEVERVGGEGSINGGGGGGGDDVNGRLLSGCSRTAVVAAIVAPVNIGI